MLGLNFTHSNCRKWTPCADISCHYLPGVRIGYPRMALPRPLPPTISVGGSGSFHLPLPLPPTISVGGSGLPLLPPSAALASHYLSGRLRPSAASAFRCPCLPLSHSAASAFRCPCLPLSQWEAQAFRCFRLPLPPPTISVGGSGSFRCFRFPLPLPPTISVGGSGLPLLPPSSGRLGLLPSAGLTHLGCLSAVPELP